MPALEHLCSELSSGALCGPAAEHALRSAAMPLAPQLDPSKMPQVMQMSEVFALTSCLCMACLQGLLVVVFVDSVSPLMVQAEAGVGHKSEEVVEEELKHTGPPAEPTVPVAATEVTTAADQCSNIAECGHVGLTGGTHECLTLSMCVGATGWAQQC